MRFDQCQNFSLAGGWLDHAAICATCLVIMYSSCDYIQLLCRCNMKLPEKLISPYSIVVEAGLLHDENYDVFLYGFEAL